MQVSKRALTLLTVGINHLTAPVAIREKVAFSADRLKSALDHFLRHRSWSEVAILSTCNRTEIYTYGGKPNQVASWLAEFHNVSPETLTPHLYHHTERQAVRHVMRVACGLDSMVIGEPQILGQLKDAVSQAREVGTIQRQLGRLFESAFAVAKRVRTDTAIGKETLSIAFAAVKLTGHIFADLKKVNVLLVGAGDTVELVANYFQQQKVSNITIANRTLKKAEDIATRFGGTGIDLSHLADHLWRADVVVCATASPTPIIGKGIVEKALRLRKNKPMLLIDLAVPRDIEAEIAKLSDVYLYTIDDLHSVIEDNLQSRKKAALEAEAIIEIHAARFMEWVQSQNHIALLRDFRDSAFSIRDQITEKALSSLQRGENTEAVIKRMGYELTNKLLHKPTTQLREAATRGDETLLQSAASLLGIKEHDEE